MSHADTTEKRALVRRIHAALAISPPDAWTLEQLRMMATTCEMLAMMADLERRRPAPVLTLVKR